ncbi:PspC domain-containing protein [Pseudactinotalea sp. HY160]|uniref:PspC domain-containing protein n=1 Tax=Pseudactinotalea sp. HY160 TaxID=2654490 RepID=UPI00128BAB71|nr:PspC domain-containing protein [Pseudactinotalea sp. HY160]MPV50796.1 PspC domain-containing protein [Pseudactinotalea sp. HY160]
MHSTQEQTSPPQAPGASFFASIRRAGIVRTQNRWGGGVAGGLARRFNIDPAIMRGVFVIVTLFSGVGLLVYGLCWALLPEETDGRIHLEEAMAGRFDAALAAAGAALVIGLARPGLWFAPFGGSGAWGIFIAIIAVGAVVALVAVARSRSSGGAGPGASGPGASGPTGATGGPPGQEGAGAPAATAEPTAHTGAVAISETRALPVASAAAGRSEPEMDTSRRVTEDPAPMAPTERFEAARAGAAPTEQLAPVSSDPAATEKLGAGPAAAGPAGATDAAPPLWSGQPRPYPLAPPQADPTAPTGQTGPTGPSGPTGPWGQYRAPMPSRRRTSRPGYRLVLLGLAGVFLVLAGVLLAWFSGYVSMAMPPLVMAGGALVAVGVVVTIAGLLGRRGGLLSLVSIVGLVVAGSLVIGGFDNYGSGALTWDSSRTIAHAPATYQVTDRADLERFEAWYSQNSSGPTVLDFTTAAASVDEAGLDLGSIALPPGASLDLRIPADVPFDVRVTGENAWVDAWDLSGVRAHATRAVQNWGPEQWVLGAGGSLDFTSALVGEPLRLHLDAPESATSIQFVQEQS